MTKEEVVLSVFCSFCCFQEAADSWEAYQDIYCSSNLEYYFSTDFNLIFRAFKNSLSV